MLSRLKLLNIIKSTIYFVSRMFIETSKKLITELKKNIEIFVDSYQINFHWITHIVTRVLFAIQLFELVSFPFQF